MLIYSKYKQIEFKQLSNIIAPGLPLFHFWGRIGCFFAGCCYGKVANWGIALETEPDILRIPIQLIESFLIFIIFISLLLIEWKFQNCYNLLHIYLFLYGIVRIFTEFYRDDSIRGVWFGISTSQWISLLIIMYLIVQKLYGKHCDMKL